MLEITESGSNNNSSDAEDSLHYLISEPSESTRMWYDSIMDPVALCQGCNEEERITNQFSTFTIQQDTIESGLISSSEEMMILDDYVPVCNQFKLLEQPYPKQRKCYKNENRYILPNPLAICPIDNRSFQMITEGTVRVKLVNANGGSVVHPYALDRLLELETRLYPNLSCQFTLKVLENSPPSNPFRLEFDITYKTTNRRVFNETILSSPFSVTTNKLSLKKEPTVTDIMPKSGFCNAVTELWIKGRDFNSSGIVVMIDGIACRILSACHNLVAVQVPERLDFKFDAIVDVMFINQWRKRKGVPSRNIVSFTYLAK